MKGQEEFIGLHKLRERDRGRHINKQEGVALWESIKRECLNFPDVINNEIVFCRVDNKVLYDVLL